jgi:hypothetical protein
MEDTRPTGNTGDKGATRAAGAASQAQQGSRSMRRDARLPISFCQTNTTSYQFALPNRDKLPWKMVITDRKSRGQPQLIESGGGLRPTRCDWWDLCVWWDMMVARRRLVRRVGRAQPGTPRRRGRQASAFGYAAGVTADWPPPRRGQLMVTGGPTPHPIPNRHRNNHVALALRLLSGEVPLRCSG